MKNYKVIMAYLGTAYHGFQRQGNAYTVQQAVEEAMSGLLGETVTIYGCSRTDAGVHARQFCFFNSCAHHKNNAEASRPGIRFICKP